MRVQASQRDLVDRLKDLKAAIERGELKDLDYRGIKTLWFAGHLYRPLLYVDSGAVEVFTHAAE